MRLRKNINILLVLIFAFVSGLNLLSVPKVLAAAPNCILLKEGNNPFDENNFQYSVLGNCRQSEYASIHNFKDNTNYKITIKPDGQKEVIVLEGNLYQHYVDIINNPNQKKVRCNDGELHAGTKDQTNEQVCANFGGWAPVGSFGSDCIGADVDRDRCDCSQKGNLDKDNCSAVAYLIIAIRVLSGLVGIIVILMIIIGGIQYSAARNDPQAIAAARGRVTNAVLALLFYLFIFAILQWLVPGGVL